VKVRGHRVELGEIEAELCAHPAVRLAVAVLREETPGDQRLVCYFVSESDRVVTTSELRRFLERKIPEYALPSVFVAVEALPVTPSGKIDRNALPAPPATRPALEKPQVEPRTSVEEALSGIWREVLAIPEV